MSEPSAKTRGYTYLLLALVAATAGYVALFAHVSLSRTQQFSPDSLVYVDAAHHVGTGHGATRSSYTYYLHEYRDDGLPVPLTDWPPLFPFVIAAFMKIGMTSYSAALLVPVVFFGLAVLVSYGMLSEILGRGPAIAGAAFMLAYGPMNYVASYAWSETLAVGLSLICLHYLARGVRNDGPGNSEFLVAGLAAGLAVSARYAMLPLILLGIVVAISSGEVRTRVRRTVLFVVPPLVMVSPILVRNVYETGAWFGRIRELSEIGLVENLAAFHWAMAGDFLVGRYLSMNIHTIIFWLAIVILVVAAIVPRTRPGMRDAVVRRGAWIPIAWVALYAAFLIANRTAYSFDYIGARLVVPAGAILFPLLVGLLARIAQLKPRAIALAAIVFIGLACFEQYTLVHRYPDRAIEAAATRNDRLRWIRENAGPGTLIIADFGNDIPFYVPLQHTVSLWPIRPTKEPFSYAVMSDYVRRHGEKYSAIYIVLDAFRNQFLGVSEERSRFMRDLYASQSERYPGVERMAGLNDTLIYHVQPSTLSGD